LCDRENKSYDKVTLKCEFKKDGFQHREGWMKLGTEERSVRWVREHQKARVNPRFDAEMLPDLLRDQKRTF
jgi:hypothetical protein